MPQSHNGAIINAFIYLRTNTRIVNKSASRARSDLEVGHLSGANTSAYTVYHADTLRDELCSWAPIFALMLAIQFLLSCSFLLVVFDVLHGDCQTLLSSQPLPWRPPRHFLNILLCRRYTLNSPRKYPPVSGPSPHCSQTRLSAFMILYAFNGIYPIPFVPYPTPVAIAAEVFFFFSKFRKKKKTYRMRLTRLEFLYLCNESWSI